MAGQAGHQRHLADVASLFPVDVTTRTAILRTLDVVGEAFGEVALVAAASRSIEPPHQLPLGEDPR